MGRKSIGGWGRAIEQNGQRERSYAPPSHAPVDRKRAKKLRLNLIPSIRSAL